MTRRAHRRCASCAYLFRYRIHAWPGCQSRTSGQALVEFALATPVLILLLFGVMEFGRMLESWVTIQHAVEEASRYATTGAGYNQGSGVRETQVIAQTKAAAVGLKTDDAAGPFDPGYFRVNIRSSRSGPDPAQNDAGGPNDFVEVDVDYNHPIIAPILGQRTSYVTLHSSAMVLNEHFARPTGRVGDLPPTPVATWTPTATPTPAPTPTP